MRSAIIKKASQDEQQNQTTIKQTLMISNVLCPFLQKKLINMVKIASDKAETKQKICISLKKRWDQCKISPDFVF